jgi:putative membrane protein
MQFIIKILVSSLALFLAAYLIPGVSISDYPTAILVALVISLLNIFLKPILILFTIPITIFTFGVFLFFINAIIIYIASSFINGFTVQSFWDAFIFSLLLSIIQFLFGLPDSIQKKKKSTFTNSSKQTTVDIEYEEVEKNE